MALLTVKEAAERVKLSPLTIRRLLREGALNGVKVGKRQWRVNENDLVVFVQHTHDAHDANSMAYKTEHGTILRVQKPRYTYPGLDEVEPKDLKALLSQITPENLHPEVDWGAPVGKEVW
ncbi:MAG TPA: excisionase family DNA-binding protein [Chloroflexia bacterium]|jgi:excisionase family DNA binding protein